MQKPLYNLCVAKDQQRRHQSGTSGVGALVIAGCFQKLNNRVYGTPSSRLRDCRGKTYVSTVQELLILLL